LFVVFADKKQLKHVEKMPEIWKNSSQKWWWHFYKTFQQMHKFWSLESRSQTSSLGLRVFDKVSVSYSNFQVSA